MNIKNNFILKLLFFYNLCASIHSNTRVVREKKDDFFVFLTNKPPYISPTQVGNTPSLFISYLAEKLELEYSYSVALVELHFQTNWLNVDAENTVRITSKFKFPDPMAFYFNEYAPMIVEPRNYLTVEELIKELNLLILNNKEVYNFKQVPSFSIDFFSSRVKINSGTCLIESTEIECFPVLNMKLSELLGFVNEDNIEFNSDNYQEFLIADTIPYNEGNFERIEKLKEKKVSFLEIYFTQSKSNSSGKLSKSETQEIAALQVLTPYKVFEALSKNKIYQPQHFNIYTDIIANEFDSNNQTTLASFNLPADHVMNETIIISFDEPIFHRVGVDNIQEILILIEDERNRLINFTENSTVWAVLEFRKIEI